MITINNPIRQGKLLTYYLGNNVKIVKSKNRFTDQLIRTFFESKMLNGGVIVQDCVEFELLNRKFLIAFKSNQLYEILTDGTEKIYILLTSSSFDVTARFLKNNEYINNISLYLMHEYTPTAIFKEKFEMQLNMKISNEVMHWYRNAMEENYNNI